MHQIKLYIHKNIGKIQPYLFDILFFESVDKKGKTYFGSCSGRNSVA